LHTFIPYHWALRLTKRSSSLPLFPLRVLARVCEKQRE